MNQVSPVLTYPNLREMSEMLRVPKSTLSQRKLASEPVGNQKRFPPKVVLEQAARYKRRPVNDVADLLVLHARELAGASAARAMLIEVKTAMAALDTKPAAVVLEELSREFDRLLEQMQDGDYGDRFRDALASRSSGQLGRAAVEMARRSRAVPRRA